MFNQLSTYYISHHEVIADFHLPPSQRQMKTIKLLCVLCASSEAGGKTINLKQIILNIPSIQFLPGLNKNDLFIYWNYHLRLIKYFIE